MENIEAAKLIARNAKLYKRSSFSCLHIVQESVHVLSGEMQPRFTVQFLL